MATTTIRRSDKDTTNGSSGSSSSGGFHIPPVVIVFFLCLGWNMLKAQYKNVMRNLSQDSMAPAPPPLDIQQEEEPTVTLSELLAEGHVDPPSLTSSSTGGLQVRSNFLDDEDLLAKFQNSARWEACVTKSQELHCQWLDIDATPTNIWEEMAVEIWKDHPALDSDESNVEIEGYEFWCNIIQPGYPLDWHVDKDEVDYEHNEHLRAPYMGAVWYGYPHELSGGGFLEVFPYHPNDIPDPTAFADLTNHLERIAPEYNRLVFLNVSQWHRVTPIADGARYTLAVNIWTKRPKQPPQQQRRQQQKTTSQEL